jgi:predicted TIM-barrel fold metal-dependent hydrolase
MVQNGSSRRGFLKQSAMASFGMALTSGIPKFIKSASGASLNAELPIIDIHQHLHYVGRSDEQLLAHQRKMGAVKTVLLPAGSLAYTASTHFGDTNGLLAGAWGNRACYEFAQKHANFYFGACEVPDLPDATKELEKYLKLGAKIIGELKFGIACDSPEMQKIYRLADQYDVPVLMHWQYKKFNYGFDRFHTMLVKYPRVKFIAHSQTWWANISGNYVDWSDLYPKGPVAPGGLTVEYLKKYPNLYGDLSAGSGYFALARDQKFTERFLIDFQDKLVFGSDCTDSVGSGKTCYGSRTIKLIESLEAGTDVGKKILYGNAQKLLKI